MKCCDSKHETIFEKKKYCKSANKPPSQISPLSLIAPTFQGKKVNKPPSSPSFYSSLINDRMNQSQL